MASKIINVSDTWIQLAISDLKSAKILYEQKQYRTSYFLFQQASEKTVKAHALKYPLVRDVNFKSIGHDQFKILRRFTVERIKAMEQALKDSNGRSEQLKKRLNELDKSLRSIDSLRNHDLINLSNGELNSLYKELTSLRIPFRTKYPQLKQLKKKVSSHEIYSLVMNLFEFGQEIFFITGVIYSCAILTIKHSSLARYPEDGKNPIDVYKAKLPLIKKQMLFMNLLEEAIRKLKRPPHKNLLHKKIEKMGNRNR